MSSDVEHIAETIATELASEHCTYYLDKKTKTVRSYFRKQLHQSWGLAAHRGWARLLLDRRCLIGTSTNPATARAAIVPATNTTKRPRMIAI